MRSFVTRVAAVATVVLGLLLVATPAFAAEATGEEVDTKGIILTFIVGIVIGTALYIDVIASSEPEDLPAPPREH